MKKLLLSVLLTLCIALSLLPDPACAADGIACPVTGGNIYFDAATGTITGCDYEVTEAIIPSTIGGVTVTGIGNDAFLQTSVTRVVIPAGVTHIDDMAFCRCFSLTSVTIPEGVTSIGDYAFSDTALPAVTIPESVTSIGTGAFDLCGNLTAITIPANVTTIGDGVFSECSSLANITVAPGNPAYVSEDGALLTADRTRLLAYPAAKTTPTSYDIPASVTSISYGAFAECSLTGVTIPEGITELGYRTFASCKNMRTVTLPASLASIGLEAFYWCDNLTDVYYGGSENQWAGINIDFAFSGEQNPMDNALLTADIHCAAPAASGTYAPYRITGNYFAATFDAAKVEKKTVSVRFSGTGDVENPNQTWDVMLVRLRPGSHVSVDSLQNVGDGPCVGAHPGERIDDSHYIATQLGGVDYILVSGTAETSFRDVGKAPSQKPNDLLWIGSGFDPDNAYFIIVDTETGGGFIDVPADKYYAEPVAWAVEKGIASGTSSTQFSPRQNCTNAQILTFLWRAYGRPEPTGSNPFTNAIPEAYEKAACWAYEQGMVSSGVFDVNGPCTRAMAVRYMWQMAGSPAAGAVSAFSDVPASVDYAQAVSWAVANGITNGTTPTQFSPDTVCTRAQIVTFLWRSLA